MAAGAAGLGPRPELGQVSPAGVCVPRSRKLATPKVPNWLVKLTEP